MSTSVPPIVFLPTGPQGPSEAAVLAGVQQDINSAFGGNLNFALNTPQGQLASSETAIIGQANNEFLFLSSMLDPAYNYGRWQDGIARIYFLYRNGALPTTVVCTCSGASGVVIPSGALAQDTSGNTYYCVTGGTISGLGTASLSFANQIPGPTPCPSGTLTIIVQTIAGWDSITNPSTGVIGTATETRAAFETRREASVAGNSSGPISAILGAVVKVPGVIDYYGYNNNTSGTVVVNGQAITAYSIYIAAVGGTDAAVAQAIFSRKGPGAPMVGNTAVTVYDTNPLFETPPAYTITFERPPDVEILFAVSIVAGNGIPSDAATQIQNLFVNAFAGIYQNVPRPRINSLILASVFSALMQERLPWAVNAVRSVLLGSQNTAGAQFTATISGTNMTVSAVASGTIIPNSATPPGQTLIDANGTVPAGTTIVSQTSGTTGGTGVYVISNSVTVVVGETMYGIFANQNSVQVQANQEPVTSAAFIMVTVA